MTGGNTTMKTLFGVAIRVQETLTMGLDKYSGPKRNFAGIKTNFRSISSICCLLYGDY